MFGCVRQPVGREFTPPEWLEIELGNLLSLRRRVERRDSRDQRLSLFGILHPFDFHNVAACNGCRDYRGRGTRVLDDPFETDGLFVLGLDKPLKDSSGSQGNTVEFPGVLRIAGICGQCKEKWQD